MTKLLDPDHGHRRSVSHSDTAGTDGVVAMLCAASAFNAGSSSLHISYIGSACVLLAFLSKQTPWYLRLFVRSVTALLQQTAGIVYPSCCFTV